MYFEQNKTRIYLSIIDVRTLDVESIAINSRARARVSSSWLTPNRG